MGEELARGATVTKDRRVGERLRVHFRNPVRFDATRPGTAGNDALVHDAVPWHGSLHRHSN